jgi:hypothetical protein
MLSGSREENATRFMAGATGVTVAEQPAEPPAESAP